MMDAIITIGSFAYLTYLQAPPIACIITISSTFFSALYLFLRQTRCLHPPTNKIEPNMEAEWRSRIIGTLHAIIISIGSLYCFNEWIHFAPLANPMHAWHVPSDDLPLPKDYIVVPLASFFLGYLQYDMLWMILHKEKNFDVGMMVHHSLFIAITHYVLQGYFLVKPFAWLGLCEVSTPFLHLRWFYAVLGKKENKLYFVWSTLFMMTFVGVRVAGYGMGLNDLWSNYGYWKDLPYGFYAVIGGLHIGYLLNIFWGGFVLLSFVKNLKRRKIRASGLKDI